MQIIVSNLLLKYEEMAIVISIFINILISIFGFIPSVFLTAANITVFGFWEGTFVSFLGETIGAVIAFYLYRIGFKRITEKAVKKYQRLNPLLEATGLQAFFLILSFRLLPFIPSSMVTFVAAVGKVSTLVFIFASSIGKVPALFMEAYTTNEVLAWSNQGKMIIAVFAVLLLYIAWRGRENKWKRKRKW